MQAEALATTETVAEDSRVSAFIETQLPVSRLSKECYKERKAGPGQTLTPLGSYWKGRKPLMLVRAAILGCLLPATSDPVKDRDIFLKLMLMDDAGLRKRWNKSLPAPVVAKHLSRGEYSHAIAESGAGKLAWSRGVAVSERKRLQEAAFERMGYDEKLEYCLRPEETALDLLDDIWPEVNAHLGTSANSIAGLVDELGRRQFGRRPRVADTFCGGGSIPFEAARMGCEVHASDLNPVAAMLTWGALNVVGGSEELHKAVTATQKRVAEEVRKEIDGLGIETGEDGWRGKVYLYCLETKCPQTGWMIPLAPNWLISVTHKVVGVLVPDQERKRFEIQILTGASDEQVKAAKSGTVRDGFVHHPAMPNVQIRMSTIRDGLLRLWRKESFEPLPEDIYQERLYCVQWTRARGETEFRTVRSTDLEREDKATKIVRAKLGAWQEAGLVPAMMIETGEETARLKRERGWTYWHHLFNARQLLTLALYKKRIDAIEDATVQGAMRIVFCKMLDWHNRLCGWDGTAGCDKVSHVFYNQAFNTMLNYGARGAVYLENRALTELPIEVVSSQATFVEATDATQFAATEDIAITDPPYGDAINYQEITEFFIAWMQRRPPKVFADWLWDSRRALAVQGNDLHFRKTMVAAYSALARGMPENGIQIVTFTHGDPAVWAGIAQIMWAAGLQVTAAWSVGTETIGGVRQGNLVQGTVLLVLRRRKGGENAFAHKLRPLIKIAVVKHLEMMRALDDK